MLKMTKKMVLLIPLIILFGCYYLSPVNYIYRTNDRYPIFTESDIQKNPTIGIALLSKEGAQNTLYIKSGIYKFVQDGTKKDLDYEILFQNIGAEILIDENRHITNIDTINRKYPQMRYALILWKNIPIVEKKSWDSPRDIELNGKTKTVYDVEYQTTLSIDCELVLSDLFDKKILARSIRKIDHTATYTKMYVEPKTDFVSELLGTLIGSSSSKLDNGDQDFYPIVDEKSVERKFVEYVYYFLKYINEKK